MERKHYKFVVLVVAMGAAFMLSNVHPFRPPGPIYAVKTELILAESGVPEVHTWSVPSRAEQERITATANSMKNAGKSREVIMAWIIAEAKRSWLDAGLPQPN